MARITILLTLLVLSIVACTTPIDKQNTNLGTPICNSPYIHFEEGCCLDQNNNSICDDHEQEEQEPVGSSDNEQEEVVQPAASEERYELPPLTVAIKNVVPSNVNEGEENYLTRFKDKPTRVIHGTGEHEAPLVAATINILTYYSFADHISTAKENLLQHNLILLGNPCNNDLLWELLGAPDDCSEGFEEDTGYLKLMQFNNKEILMIMATDPVLVHGIINVLVHDQIPYQGTDVEFEIID